MTKKKELSADSDSLPLRADGNVEIIGGNQYVYQADLVPSNTALSELEEALARNRKNLEEYERELEDLIADGRAPNDRRIQATIKNALASLSGIESLVPTIRLRGGSASFSSQEASPAVRLNNVVSRGEARFRERQKRIREIERRGNWWYVLLSATRRLLDRAVLGLTDGMIREPIATGIAIGIVAGGVTENFSGFVAGLIFAFVLARTAPAVRAKVVKL